MENVFTDADHGAPIKIFKSNESLLHEKFDCYVNRLEIVKHQPTVPSQKRVVDYFVAKRN